MLQPLSGLQSYYEVTRDLSCSFDLLPCAEDWTDSINANPHVLTRAGPKNPTVTRWNQTEPRPGSHPEMAMSPKRWADLGTGYGVVKRRSKATKGVQTDDTSDFKLQMCWRHSRNPAARDEALARPPAEPTQVSARLLPGTRASLRNALPNFHRWTRSNKKADGGESIPDITEAYLGNLYRPYSSVRKQINKQALERCTVEGREYFEAHYLAPVSLILRKILDCEESIPSSWRRRKNNRTLKRKRHPGWPLCSRGRLLVHLTDLDSSLLRPGDFYFTATPVGIALKWQDTDGRFREKSLDEREFSSEMATLLATKKNPEVKDLDGPSHLLVTTERGVQKIEVSRLADDLWKWEGRHRRGATRDSWVQTDESKVDASVAEEAVLQPLAPLASEEEFCSDTEQRHSPLKELDDRLELPKTSSEQINQPNVIDDIAPEALKSRLALMPGSRDIHGRSVIYISLEALQHRSLTSAHLAQLLLYFRSIPKRETMCLGFLATIDCRQATAKDWDILREALFLVENSFPGTISLVLAWQKPNHIFKLQTTRFPTFHIKFEVITNGNQLLNYFSKDQLLTDFGGTYKYDHEEWIRFRQFVDPFIVNCHQSGCHLVKVIEEMPCSQLSSNLTTAAIEQQKKRIVEALENEQIQYLEKEAEHFLQQLEEYGKKFPDNLDYKEAVEKSTELYKQLKKVVQRLAKLADERFNKLQECMMLKIFEEESSQVLAWLHRKGEETLKKHKTLAKTLNAIREQENEFEKFYFLAMRQIERGNDLLEEIPKARSLSKETGANLLKQRLDDFADRLEDAREKLEDTSRCYQLLDKVYEWALETMRFVSHMKIDSTTTLNALIAILRRLDTYLYEHPYINEDVFIEMVELATKLCNERLLAQCETAKTKYQETVELIRARQETLQNAKEQMIKDSEKSNFNENLDSLKTKPCLWNPMNSNIPFRTPSRAYLSHFNSIYGSQLIQQDQLGSYTSFPSSYYPIPSYRERLLNTPQQKHRLDYLHKRGSLTDDVFSQFGPSIGKDLPFSQGLRENKSKSYVFSSDCLNSIKKNGIDEFAGQLNNASRVSKPNLEDDRNWKMCEEALKKVTEEVRHQNDMLQQKQLNELANEMDGRLRNWKENLRPLSTSFVAPSFTSSNPEEFQKPAPVNSHLMRCASCSDFEELLSSKTSNLDISKTKTNSRTLKLVMMEMVQTERDYVKSLGYIIENYVPLLQQNNINQALRCQRNILFGNIERIYEFHNCYFLQELEQCESSPYSVGQCFLKYETQFYLYALYNKNKPKSDSLLAEYGNLFKQKQQELGDKMDLASYLLKPVQRMGKYALLLKQILKECPETNSEHYNSLKAAEEMVCFQLRHGNDLLAMDALRECDVNVKEQGRLLRQDEFLVWQGKSRKALRHVFLFEDLILFSKARRNPEYKGHDYYQYKNSMKTSDMGLTAQVGESPSKFEIWFRKRKMQDLYVLQAPSAEVKNAWVEDITNLLWKQAERNRKLRLEEMSSMGIGNKPCLDITPSQDQICDRSISLQQLNKVSRFRNSIAVSSSDNLNNNAMQCQLSEPSSRGSTLSGNVQESTSFYDTSALIEVEETQPDKRRSMAQQSQCSAESGIFTDLSMSGDSYAENVQRMKTIERSDSVLSRSSYTSLEAVTAEVKPNEISTAISLPSDHKV